MSGKPSPAALIAARGGQSDSGYGVRARRFGERVRSLLYALPFAIVASPAHAQLATDFGPPFTPGEVVQGAIVIGAVGAALICALYLIRERGRMAQQIASQKASLTEVSANLARAEALINVRDQRTIVWSEADDRPRLIGALPRESGAPEDRNHFLAFGRWLTPRSAAAIDHAAAALREHGRSFDIVVETQRGAPLEVQGRKNAAHAFMRFVALSDIQKEQARLTIENQRLTADFEAVAGLLDSIDMPFWLRSANGSQRWVNKAYASAVEADSAAAAVAGEKELFGVAVRDDIARTHARGAVYSAAVSTVVMGDRRIYELTDYAANGASAGIAVDTTTLAAAKDQQSRMARGHADTLDQLTTAVAIFDAKEKLRFFNQAFQKLWMLDLGFLESAPDHTLFLDRLRSEGKIAEHPEWRRWKEGILSAYRSVEPQEHSWHLPDGRTIRVIANPQPDGGVTWVFENLTTMIDLERDLTSAVKVQGETLDNLAEGVTLFGSDGRLRLYNPAFVRLWGLEPGDIRTGMHIAELRKRCDQAAVNGPWSDFLDAVTGFNDERRDLHGQTDMKSGAALRFAGIHLPNGQVMMTFVDVTDSVNVERALKEKNDALQRADQIKNRFLQHVSYELRSPLTNIIGFTELLSMHGAEPLSERQREYVGHIGASSSILLTVVNDILDLATVDAGVMRLDVTDLDVSRTVASAAEAVAERLEENGVKLAVDLHDAPLKMQGDETRIRQVLSNLLANAANFAPPNSSIELTCRTVSSGVEFLIHDDGPGMPPEVLGQAFEPFESRPNGGRRRGAGLGLAIVSSFVHLHGGTVRVDTGSGVGTTVICFFPETIPATPGDLIAAE